MKVPKIYLETSIFNFHFADDSPDKRDDTLRLFEKIINLREHYNRIGIYSPSEVIDYDE